MATTTVIPSNYSDLTGMSIDSSYPITRAYTDSSSTTYARFNVTQSTTGSVFFLFDTSGIPASATITSVSAQFKARVSNTSRVTNTGAQLYSGTTAKGDSTAFGSTTASVRSITAGTWTRSDLNDLRLYVTGRASSSTSSRRIDFYGADVTIEYVTETVHVTSVSVSPSTASIEVAETVQLTETVLPANATDKTVVWSSSNTSVATISNGLVTAVSVGNATITVTTNDGGYTATCAVTVTAPVYTQYRLASTMEVGKQYLIANGNSGSVYMLTNEANGSRTLKAVAATVSNGIISITGSVASRCLFDCVRYTAGNDVTITVEKNNQYLYCDNSNGLRMNAPATLDRFWHYRDNKFWQFKSTTSDGYSDTSSEYKYYLTWSNGNVTDSHVDTSGIEQSNIPLTYIYTEYTPSDEELYVKMNSSWVQVQTAYKKINGNWVEQSDLTNVFQSGVNYVKGN